jgi:hypothetical protein
MQKSVTAGKDTALLKNGKKRTGKDFVNITELGVLLIRVRLYSIMG